MKVLYHQGLLSATFIAQRLDYFFIFSPDMSAEAVFSLQNQSTTLDYSGKIPVEHLDYDYIKKCEDVKYLEKILRVLR